MDLLLKAENLLPPSIPTQSYVSMFRIDGEPILPPLMTTEKRYEMQMYREKAVELERKILLQQHKRVQFSDVGLASPRSQLDCSFYEIISHRSAESEESRQTESENIFSIPSSRSEDKQTPLKIYTNCGSNTDPLEERQKSVMHSSTNTVERSINDRMKNLHKSKTIIFDHTLCTVIKSATEEEIAAANNSTKTKSTAPVDIVEKDNLNYLIPKKSLNLPLQAIPSICVNPPTPITGPSNICDTLSATESVDSFDISGFHSSQATQNQAAEISEDTTDDSSSSQSTENMPLTSPRKVTGITARILHFEQLENETPLQQHPETARDNIIEHSFVLKPPQRSATSPSLKSITDMDLNSLTPSPRTEEGSSSHSLVRSSSFTLEGPSKALLDHFRQQSKQTISKSNNVSPHSHENARSVLNKRRATPSPSAWRDTVESKAKRVQKKLDTKSNTRPMASARSKSKSTPFNNYHNPTTQHWNSSPAPVKVKRSPYDAKSSATTPKSQTKTNTSQKNVSPPKLQKGHAVKKSVSNTTYTIKQPSARNSLPNNSIIHAVNDNIDVMNEIENRHRQRLIALIAQQQEEQRRLQHTFETQQNLLLAQLNNEMSRVHIDGQQSTPTFTNATNILRLEDDTKGQPLSPYKENSNNNYTANTISPTISVTSSYVSPGLSGALGGFTTTTTLSPCEMSSTCITPSNGPSSRSPQQKRQHPTQVGITTGIYADNISHSIGITTSPDKLGSPISHRRTSNTLQNIDSHVDRRTIAATIINAHARGFLVRRLFQTEQIQRIVQTIRDTLIFVLNLHMETIENAEEGNAPTNIKLKARLLQQLASASRTLHLIFFQTSTKERMEIIARDRKRIKTKLLTMNLKRSPRTV